MKPALIGLIAIVVAAVLWFAFQRNGNGGMAPMPGMDGMEGMDSGALGSEPGGPLADVTVPATLSAQAETGKTYFDAVCSVCHGANAAGQDGIAPPLVHVIYEPSHHGDAAFAAAARNGVTAHHWSFGNMPALQERLTDAEVGAIVAYVRELQRANGIN